MTPPIVPSSQHSHVVCRSCTFQQTQTSLGATHITYPILRWSNSYKLKYFPFDYYMHYDVIQYEWAYRHLGPHTYNRGHKWVKSQIIKHNPVQHHMTIRDRSTSHLYKLLRVARCGVCKKIIKGIL